MGIIEFVFLVIVFIYSVVLHEVSHGFVAYSLGDDTAKNLGRLTLNPIKHLDIFGSVVLPLMLLVIRAPFVFGYAKPVPYNPYNLRDKRFGPAKVALAGPTVNLTLAVMFGLILRFLPASINSILPVLLGYIVQINLLLAIFNLMPIPPLDGHWLLLAFLPDRFQNVKLFIARYSLVLFLVFLVFIFPVIFPLINFLYRVIIGQ